MKCVSFPYLNTWVYILLSRLLTVSKDYMQISIFEVYRVYSQTINHHKSGACVFGGTTVGIEKPGCLWLQKEIRYNLSFLPYPHSFLANYFSIHFLLLMPKKLAFHWMSLFHLKAHLYLQLFFSTHPSWKCLFTVQNRFERVKHWFCFCLVYWFQPNSEMLNAMDSCRCNFRITSYIKGGFDWCRGDDWRMGGRKCHPCSLTDAWRAAANHRWSY